MVYGKSNLAITGDLDVRLRYREDGALVEGATVAILALDGAQRAVVSDSDGISFFGQVAVGAVAVTVTPPEGCVVDTSTLASTAIAPDAVSTVIVYIQHPAQVTAHVTDTNGAPVVGATAVLRKGEALIGNAAGQGGYATTMRRAGTAAARAAAEIVILCPVRRV